MLFLIADFHPTMKARVLPITAGLLILKDQDKIELQFCHDSGEFSPDVDLTHLPDNGKNLIPKMEPLEPSYLEPQ